MKPSTLGTTPQRRLTTIVGIVADIENLEGVAAFMRLMPKASGLAFVVLTRGDGPKHGVAKARLLDNGGRPVCTAVSAAPLRPDHVYLAPASHSVLLNDALLQVSPHTGGGENFDSFFKSLASEQRERAIAVLISNNGRHGYAGLRAVERAGGCAIPPLRWEKPHQALGLEHLPQEQVIARVSERVSRHLTTEPQEARARAAAPGPRASRPGDQPAVELLAGMQGAPAHTLEQASQAFLSDELTFARLGQRLAMLIGAREEGVLRAWVPRCGTGQEAYGLAMLLLERLETHAEQPKLRVFGTDVDELALRVARAGAYPDSALKGLSAERRRNFFIEGEFAPRVRFQLRRHLLFAHHDVHNSAPLSRIDLLSAHHLLRDCPAELQKSLLETFHFALRDGGWLLVGPQHVDLVGHELFETIDADCGLFRAHRFTVLGNANRRRVKALRSQQPASRAELTALAEELRGVNAQRAQELKTLDRTHSDLTNFVDATGVLALICNRQLRITRSTRALRAWLEVTIEPGTLLQDLAEQLAWDREIVAMACRVQDDGTAEQRTERFGQPPRSFLIRMQPYYDKTGGIDGVVGVFTDVTALEEARARALRRGRQQAIIAELGMLALLDADAAGPGAHRELHRRALRALSEPLGCEKGLVLETGRETSVLLIAASFGLKWAGSVPAGLHVSEGSALRAVFGARGAVHLDIGGESEMIGGLWSGAGIVCPLRVGDSVYGILALSSDGAHEIGDDDLNFVQAVGNVLAGAIGRQRAQRRLALEREVGLALAGADDVESMAIALSAALEKTLTVSVVGLFASPDLAGALPLRRIWPRSSEREPEAGLPPPPELEQSFQKRQCTWRHELESGVVKTELFFPILLGQQVVGVVRCRGHESIAVDDELIAGFARSGQSIGECLHWTRVDAALRESEQRSRAQSAELEAVYATLPVGLSIYDHNLRPLRTNRQLEAMQSSAKQEGALPEAILRHVLESGEPLRDVELTLDTEQGILSWLCNFAPVQTAEGSVAAVSSVVQDITDRKHGEWALREADRQKDHFLAMLGHELRNPLAAIRNATELLGMLARETPDVERAFSVLDRQTLQMAKLIDGLLDISRIMRGKLTLDRVSCDLGRLLQGIVEDHSTRLEQRQLTLVLNLPEAPVWVDGDPARLRQVFDNLLANAVKFTHEGGQVNISVHSGDDDALISVEDDGIGMEAELLPHVFEPFRQARQSIDRSIGGLGLGLSLVRGLVELHGGSVSAESPGLERGSTFEIKLPLAEHGGQPSSVPPPPGATLRVLIVEDNVDMADTLSELLRLSGHEVVGWVTTGREALERVAALRPELILCDVGLPGDLDGIDVVRALRKRDDLEAFEIIVLTGFGDPSYAKQLSQMGVKALIKPVAFDVLQKQLEKAARSLDEARLIHRT